VFVFSVVLLSVNRSCQFSAVQSRAYGFCAILHRQWYHLLVVRVWRPFFLSGKFVAGVYLSSVPRPCEVLTGVLLRGVCAGLAGEWLSKDRCSPNKRLKLTDLTGYKFNLIAVDYENKHS